MKIKDRPKYCNKTTPFTLLGDDRVSMAVETMSSRNIGAVVIVDEVKEVKGIVPSSRKISTANPRG